MSRPPRDVLFSPRPVGGFYDDLTDDFLYGLDDAVQTDVRVGGDMAEAQHRCHGYDPEGCDEL